MTRLQFEAIICDRCAPTLCGAKPANLVSFSKQESTCQNSPGIEELLAEYEEQLKHYQIHMKVICGCRKHYLVLVYRPDLLQNCLRQKDSMHILENCGYDSAWPVSRMIAHLKERYESDRGLPHEMGVFLGYPAEDVIGFCLHKGAECKYCGYWKVYGDVARARRTFAVYDRCRAYMNERRAAGISVLRMAKDIHNGCQAVVA